MRYLKNKQQGIVKVLISYQMQKMQCSTFKIATCETFFKLTKISSFFKKNLKNYASWKKNTTNKKVLDLPFTSMY